MTPAQSSPRFCGLLTGNPGRALATGLVALLISMVATVGFPATAQADDEPDPNQPQPLAVTLTQLTPAVIPQQGAITLRGTVQNRSDEEWRDINVAAFISRSPIVDRDALADAANSDPITAPVGERLQESPGFVGIGDLGPGSTRSFMVRIPQRLLDITGEAGVYWIGAQALGANDTGRDSRAEGRARTFIPLVPSDSRSTASLIVPVRGHVGRVSDGSLLRPGQLAQVMSPDGRLGRVAGLLSQVGDMPVAMLVDPALLNAADDIENDNPAMNMGPRSTGAPDPDPSDSATPGSSGGPAPPSLDEAARAGAELFRTRIESEARSLTLLGLPYGDVDAAGLGRRAPSLFAAAAAASDAAFEARSMNSTLTVAPPAGWLDLEALDKLTDDLFIIGSDHGETLPRRHISATGQSIVLADSQAGAGGARPTPSGDALGLRQRILGDAALEAIGGAGRPLVVSLPREWDPGRYWSRADFFEGLNQPWLTWEPVDATGTGPILRDLPYPDHLVKQEVDASLVDAASSLIANSKKLGSLLSASTNNVTAILGQAAFAAVSYNGRRTPGETLALTRMIDQRARDRLEAVHLSTDPFVTLSGGSGSVPVSIVNGLDYPVTVGLEASSDDPSITVTGTKPVRLGAGARAAFRIDVSTDRVGVHDVTLTPVTATGKRFGSDTVLSLRTSQIGRFLSLAMKIGGAVLFVLVAFRIAQRIRTRKEGR